MYLHLIRQFTFQKVIGFIGIVSTSSLQTIRLVIFNTIYKWILVNEFILLEFEPLLRHRMRFVEALGIFYMRFMLKERE